MDINEFRKETVKCPFSKTGEREEYITRANTLKEQIQNYILQIYESAVIYLIYTNCKAIERPASEEEKMPGLTNVLEIKFLGSNENIDKTIEYVRKEIKEDINDITFSSKKEVIEYIDDKYIKLANLIVW